MDKKLYRTGPKVNVILTLNNWERDKLFISTLNTTLNMKMLIYLIYWGSTCGLRAMIGNHCILPSQEPAYKVIRDVANLIYILILIVENWQITPQFPTNLYGYLKWCINNYLIWFSFTRFSFVSCFFFNIYTVVKMTKTR